MLTRSVSHLRFVKDGCFFSRYAGSAYLDRRCSYGIFATSSPSQRLDVVTRRGLFARRAARNFASRITLAHPLRLAEREVARCAARAPYVPRQLWPARSGFRVAGSLPPLWQRRTVRRVL